MMFEDCTSRAVDKTNLFLPAFWHATGLAQVNLGEVDNEEKNGNTYERNQNKDVIIIINTRTRKENFTPFKNFFIIGENKNSKQKMGGIY